MSICQISFCRLFRKLCRLVSYLINKKMAIRMTNTQWKQDMQLQVVIIFFWQIKIKIRRVDIIIWQVVTTICQHTIFSHFHHRSTTCLISMSSLNYVNMRIIYVNMQQNYVNIQHNGMLPNISHVTQVLIFL